MQQRRDKNGDIIVTLKRHQIVAPEGATTAITSNYPFISWVSFQKVMTSSTAVRDVGQWFTKANVVETAREVPYRHMRTPEKWPSNVCMGKFRKTGWIVLFVKIVKKEFQIILSWVLHYCQPGWIGTHGVKWDPGLKLGDTFSLCLSRLEPWVLIHPVSPDPPRSRLLHTT